MSFYLPYCYGCVHYGKGTRWPDACRAFPRGIPSEIFHGRKPHDKVLPGQEGNYVRTPEEGDAIVGGH